MIKMLHSTVKIPSSKRRPKKLSTLGKGNLECLAASCRPFFKEIKLCRTSLVLKHFIPSEKSGQPNSDYKENEDLAEESMKNYSLIT